MIKITEDQGSFGPQEDCDLFSRIAGLRSRHDLRTFMSFWVMTQVTNFLTQITPASRMLHPPYKHGQAAP